MATRNPFRTLPAWSAVAAAVEHRRSRARLDADLKTIAAYHLSGGAADRIRPLPDRVWSDLEMDSVFTRVDHCTSAIGKQVLYDMLRCPLMDADAVAGRDRLIRELAGDAGLRARIAGGVAGLRSTAALDLHHLVTHDLPRRPAWFVVLPILPVLAVAAIIIMLVDPLAGLLLLVGTVAVNIGIQVFYRPHVQHLVRPIAALPALLTAARRLSRLDSPAAATHTRDLARLSSRLRWLGSPVRHIVREVDSTSPAGMVAAYMNLLFLTDILAFAFSIRTIERHRAEILSVIRIVGELDALCAVVAFRATLPTWCAPDLDAPRNHVHGAGIYHPVIDGAVPNDLDLEATSVLVTGSNMAGKTTYLRAAGVCAVLAQTVATCPAARWRAPCLRVETLIGRQDDLLHGRSYFMVEAELVRELLAAAAGETPHLFLLDELFRGTNTHERVAAGHAVLDRLGRDHLCIGSTHDAELAALLDDAWQFAHFQESWTDGRMVFDYRIRSGAAGAGNALKVLEMTGYPDDVLRTAHATFAKLSHPFGWMEADDRGNG